MSNITGYGGGRNYQGNTFSAMASVSADPELLTRIARIEKLIEGISKRLSVLDDPDPAKLAQYKMLKEAYTKYLFLEKLCAEEKDE